MERRLLAIEKLKGHIADQSAEQMLMLKTYFLGKMVSGLCSNVLKTSEGPHVMIAVSRFESVWS